MSIATLEPTVIWKHFYELTQIPRPSKHEAKAIDYVRDFAKTNNLEYIEDKIGNIIVKKPASSGMENRPGVVLQAQGNAAGGKVAGGWLQPQNNIAAGIKGVYAPGCDPAV